MKTIKNNFKKIMNEISFDLDSWQETHFEVVSVISHEVRKDNPCKVVADRYAEQGTGGMYELAQELTDKFQDMNQDREWDGEFFDEIESFLQAELKL